MQDISSKGIVSRLPLAPLGKLTIASLIGDALAFAILLLTILLATGVVVSPLLILTIVLLVIAGIVATGIRWTPCLAHSWAWER